MSDSPIKMLSMYFQNIKRGFVLVPERVPEKDYQLSDTEIDILIKDGCY